MFEQIVFKIFCPAFQYHLSSIAEVDKIYKENFPKRN